MCFISLVSNGKDIHNQPENSTQCLLKPAVMAYVSVPWLNPCVNVALWANLPQCRAFRYGYRQSAQPEQQ